jgi:hypothetical protein
MVTSTESTNTNNTTEDVYFNINEHAWSYIIEAVGDGTYWRE